MVKAVSGLESTGYELSAAILLRRSRGGGAARCVATIHPIHVTEGAAPTLGAGSLVQRGDLAKLCREMMPEQRMSFMDERVLAWGGDGLIWWRKPGCVRVFFRTRDEGDVGTRAGLVALPGLVFFRSGGSCGVFAVKGKERPTPTTKLYESPFYNVWEGGGICTGNMKVPSDAGPGGMEAFEEAFFGSNFTHVNKQKGSRVTRYPGGPVALWNALLDGAKRFPMSSLVPTKKTVAGLVKELGGDER